MLTRGKAGSPTSDQRGVVVTSVIEGRVTLHSEGHGSVLLVLDGHLAYDTVLLLCALARHALVSHRHVINHLGLTVRRIKPRDQYVRVRPFWMQMLPKVRYILNSEQKERNGKMQHQ